MKKLYRIALLMEKSIGYNRNVIEGIYAHSQRHKNWVFYDAAPSEESIEAIASWNVDGVIGHFYDPALIEFVKGLKIPVVNTTDSLLGIDLPLADVNHFEIGRMAGSYLASLGYQQFGYVGSARLQYSKMRLSGYKEAVGGEEVAVCELEYLPQIDKASEAQAMRERMKQWLENREKPLAVFCSNDIPARDFADVCLELGVEVPREVAILGVDNDFVECRLSRPPLSSVEIPAAAVGYAAAEMLADSLLGRPIRHDGHFSPDPVRVVERESTAVNAVVDTEVRAVLDYIDRNIDSVKNVSQLVDLVPLSRRNLELRFQACVGKGIWNVVLEKRINYARGLLQNKEVSIQEVSEACGFVSLRRFTEMFRKFVGMTPRDFKKQNS
ncbi:substrate-binding domain-containing protein [Rubritalea tangerina]|uniref:Substrate-binding domain-containing protein n=1 Tax=Rubritalea tangerina TaxID=430798 RepID=A0ABW4ZDI3_9BACT